MQPQQTGISVLAEQSNYSSLLSEKEKLHCKNEPIRINYSTKLCKMHECYEVCAKCPPQ